MRKITRGWIAGLFLVVLAGSFAIWGISDVFRGAPSNALASGPGINVTVDQFRKAFDGAIAQAAANGQQLTRPQAIDAGLHDAVLQNLVTQQAIDRLAKRMGFVVSDAMVADAIRTDDNFKNQVTGAFDRETYRRLLAQNGLTEAAYEAALRGGLVRRQLAEIAAAGVHAPTSFTGMLFHYQTERRLVDLAAITPERVGRPAPPTDAELQAFYKENEANLRTPEYRALTVVAARPSDFAAKVEVPEDKIRQLYEYKKPSLASGETRDFVQIAAPDETTAVAAGKRLAAGEAAEAVAESMKLQAIPFEKVGKDQVPDQAVAAAAFTLSPGEVSGAVHGKLAWAVVKLEAIHPGVAPTYESQREALRQQLAADQAQADIADAVEKFHNDRAAGKSVEDAAKDSGLALSTYAAIDDKGAGLEGAPVTPLSDSPEVLKAAFAAAQGDVTDFISNPAGQSLLVRVDKVTPPGVRKLEDVKDMLQTAWMGRKTGEAMRKLADKIRDDVAAGKSFAAAAKAAKVQLVGRDQPMDRRALQGGPAPMLAQAVFSAAKGDVVSAPTAKGDALLVAQLTQIERQDPAENTELFEQARQAGEQMIAADLLQTVQAVAVTDAKVKENKKLLNQTLGIDQPAETK